MILKHDPHTSFSPEGDGYVVTVRKNWLRPAVKSRCGCQQSAENLSCICGEGAVPTGVCSRLYWDKVNNENR